MMKVSLPLPLSLQHSILGEMKRKAKKQSPFRTSGDTIVMQCRKKELPHFSHGYCSRICVDLVCCNSCIE